MVRSPLRVLKRMLRSPDRLLNVLLIAAGDLGQDFAIARVNGREHLLPGSRVPFASDEHPSLSIAHR